MKGRRKALLVGSLPYEDERQAMTRAVRLFGDNLIALPDGEIGPKSAEYPRGYRSAWVTAIIDRCTRNSGAFQVVRPGKMNPETGFQDGYTSGTRLRAKYPPGELHRHIDTGWLDSFKSSYPVFRQLREDYALPDLKFQVGLPTGLGITFAMLSPVQAVRYAQAFNRRLAWEANEMLKIAGDDIVFQLEVPGELKFAYMLPGFMTKFATRSVLGLARLIRPQVPFGIHFCFGDLNHEGLINSPTLERLVHFSNTVVEGWPGTHRLAYLHYPLAEANVPPPLDPRYYLPLGDLNIPPGTRFVGGFVHEGRTPEEHAKILGILTRVRSGTVDVACSCGLGRRSPEVADQLNELTSRLLSV